MDDEGHVVRLETDKEGSWVKGVVEVSQEVGKINEKQSVHW
jgi:hypothetical protein